MKHVTSLKNICVVFSSFLFLLTFIAFAEATCGSANCSLIRGSQSGLVNKGRFIFDLSHSYILMDDKQKGSSSTSEVLTPKVDFENRTLELDHHREVQTINQLTQMDVSYGITEKLTASLNVPFRNDRRHEHYDEVNTVDEKFTNADGTTGMGDITLLLKYALLQTLKHQFILGAGVKFASGEYQLRDSDGTINEPTLMPGTGSYDAILSGLYIFSLIPNRLNLFTSVSHRFTTENPLDYELGDTTLVDGGMIYVLTDSVSLSAQINARIARRDEFIGMPVPSTGGEFVNLTPGVTLAASENLSLYTHVQIPIYQRVNEVNLVPNYGLLFGASYGFN
ncbi:MAG: hypothetical protein O3A78_03690 [Nitrospinae bacterium]|jgi:hypothetical protein|nr:hypothetical protein [Nitrospinota bacterium]MDA1108910.1 hypothetical protein [Nitrospinota bacterium]